MRHSLVQGCCEHALQQHANNIFDAACDNDLPVTGKIDIDRHLTRRSVLEAGCWICRPRMTKKRMRAAESWHVGLGGCVRRGMHRTRNARAVCLVRFKVLKSILMQALHAAMDQGNAEAKLHEIK